MRTTGVMTTPMRSQVIATVTLLRKETESTIDIGNPTMVQSYTIHVAIQPCPPLVSEV